MFLKLPPPPPRFKSNSQIARVITETWAEENLYCPKCGGRLVKCAENTPTKDFDCYECKHSFQLKSTSKSIGTRITGAHYETTLQAVAEKRHPSILLLQYDQGTKFVVNVLAIHGDTITDDCLEKRNPIAGRGWIGCNYILSKILRTGRVPIVFYGNIADRQYVISQWETVENLVKIMANLDGWSQRVMWIIDQLGTTFSLQDLYSYEAELAEMYPENKHIRPKIRQQLQNLRDFGLIHFEGNGNYSRVR